MERATTPVVGVVLLIAITVVAAATIGFAATTTTPDPSPSASIEVTADADRNEIAITHRGGDVLDLRALSLHVTVDGEDLTHQPPVPFFAASGFRGGPTGPFNTATDDEFGAGETAGLRLAGTNRPLLSRGSRVTVEFQTENTVIARAHTTAE